MITEKQIEELLGSFQSTQNGLDQKFDELSRLRERNIGAMAVLRYLLGDTSAVRVVNTQEGATPARGESGQAEERAETQDPVN